MNQIDRILKRKQAQEFELKMLYQLKTDEYSGGAVALLINSAIENVRDATEMLERAARESEAQT